ncbi:MAG: FkbM family methyltransferase [Solirubrobacteraceae bacterium]
MNTQRFSTDDLKVWLTRFPWLYARMRRPYATGRYLLRRPHDIDYAAFGLFPQTDGLFLDLGANAGMSSLSLRIYQRRARILALEPNPFHEPDLKWTQRVVGRMEYRIWAAGDQPGEAEFFIPVYRGVPITTEASLTREFVLESPSLRDKFGARMDSSDFEIVRIRVDVRRIDDLSLRPALVKVDVQGHEQPTLSGMSQTLESDGPPVLVEAPSPETKGFMASLGYTAYRYDPATRRLLPLEDEEVTNVMFARQLPAGAAA